MKRENARHGLKKSMAGSFLLFCVFSFKTIISRQ